MIELQACPNLGCNNMGYYPNPVEDLWTGAVEWEQVQCEFCHTQPNSVFNVVNNLLASTEKAEAMLAGAELRAISESEAMLMRSIERLEALLDEDRVIMPKIIARAEKAEKECGYWQDALFLSCQEFVGTNIAELNMRVELAEAENKALKSLIERLIEAGNDVANLVFSVERFERWHTIVAEYEQGKVQR